jgi:hypothetical protein
MSTRRRICRATKAFDRKEREENPQRTLREPAKEAKKIREGHEVSRRRTRRISCVFVVAVFNFAQTADRDCFYSGFMQNDKYYVDLYQQMLEVITGPGLKTAHTAINEDGLSGELNRRGNKISFRYPAENESSIKFDS